MVKKVRYKSAMILSALVLCGAPVWFGISSVSATGDEIIVTAKLANQNTGEAFPGAAIVLVDANGNAEILSHGDRTTVLEGEVFRLIVLGVRSSEFLGWEPWNALRTRAIDVSFAEDTVVAPQLARFPTNDGDKPLHRTGGHVHSTDALSGAAVDSGIEDDSRKVSFDATQESNIQKSMTEVWVNFRHVGLELGTESQPFDTAQEGAIKAGSLGGTIDPFPVYLDGGYSEEKVSINPANPIRLEALNNAVRIGGDYTHWYYVDVEIVGSGGVSGGGGYAAEQSAILTAAPSAGWEFSHWSGDLSGYTNPETLTVDSDKTVNAVFVQDPAQLDVTSADFSDLATGDIVAGATFDIAWEVTNSGATADSDDDDWTDNVFLSRDDVFDDSDKAIGTGHTATEAESYTDGATTITIPDVSPGDYYLIIRTDIDNEVLHTQAGRAATIASHQITIIDPELQ